MELKRKKKKHYAEVKIVEFRKGNEKEILVFLLQNRNIFVITWLLCHLWLDDTWIHFM